MFTVKSSNMMINEEIKVEYNGSLLLNKKDGKNAIVFILLIPDHNIIKIDCYYHTLDRERIINHLKSYFSWNCNYILTISGDPRKMFTTSDIQFIKDKLGSNFIEMLNKKNSWILAGTKEENSINNIAELVDENSITYSFPIEIKTETETDKTDDSSSVINDEADDQITKYPSHPLYDLKKHTFIKDESYIASKFLFIGGNFSNNDTIEIDTIDSPYELDIDNVKRYMAIILWLEVEEHIEKWNLCTIMQGVPVFSKFYKRGTIQFKNEEMLLNYLATIRKDPSIAHKIAYETSKPFWEWNNFGWKVEEECFKKGVPLVERRFNIQYITIIRNISDLTNVLKIFWNQVFNGNRYINIYTTLHLYSDLINIINDNNIKLYVGNSITFKTQLVDNIDYLIYLDPNAKYSNDYTKNILYNFDVATHINIIGKGAVNYCFTLDIPLGSLCCRVNNDHDNDHAIKTFENMIKKGTVTEEVYSIDPYEFS